MAQVENRVTRNVTPASGTAPSTPSYPQVPGVPRGADISSVPDIKRFNSITATRAGASRSILSRPAGNIAEIVVCGIRGTPNDLIDRILEHEHDHLLRLLDQALA